MEDKGRYPELLESYLRYCRMKESCGKAIELPEETPLTPVEAAPLISLVIEKKCSIKPRGGELAGFIRKMAAGKPGTYTGHHTLGVRLPKDRNKCDPILQKAYRLYLRGSEKGTGAFKYIMAELVDNVYQHSKAKNAIIIAQPIPGKKTAEICFFDNGVSIPKGIKDFGMHFENDAEAIDQAMGGLSTKPEEGRGWGLGTSLLIITKGMGGEALVVSGKGAVYLNGKGRSAYAFQNPSFELKGTLVGARLPYPLKDVNIYEYIG